VQINLLGRGSTAAVYRAMDSTTLELVAVKALNMDMAGHWRSMYASEVHALQAFSNAGCDSVPTLCACKSDSSRFNAAICTNLMNLGTADHWATSSQPCPEPLLAHVAYCLLQVRKTIIASLGVHLQ
jgi:serine/threonine protein kinase